jgi:hypothetical protein
MSHPSYHLVAPQMGVGRGFSISAMSPPPVHLSEDAVVRLSLTCKPKENNGREPKMSCLTAGNLEAEATRGEVTAIAAGHPNPRAGRQKNLSKWTRALFRRTPFPDVRSIVQD